MKYIILLFLLVGFIPVQDASADLILWYKFDETSGTVASDFTGSSNASLTSFNYNSDSNWMPGAGKFGGALRFDGINDVLVNSSFVHPTAAFTYAFWFKPDANLQAGSGRDDFHYGSSYSRPHITFDREGDGKIGIYTTINGNVSDLAKSTSNSWTANTWYHVAFSFDGAQVKVYVNGNCEGTFAQSGVHQAGTGFHIGASSASGTQAFDGMIDDYAIWNEALSPSAIGSIVSYGIGNPVPEPFSGVLVMIGLFISIFSVHKKWQGKQGIMILLIALAISPAQIFADPVLQNLKLWLRADSLTGLQNGAAVTTWSDGSGLGHDAYASGSSTPTYYSSAINGKATLRFDGGDQLFISGSSDYNFTETTIFTVHSPQNRAGTVISIAQDGTGYDHEFLLYGDNTYHHTSGGVFTTIGHQSVPSTVYFSTSVIGTAPSDMLFRINGITSTTSTVAYGGGGSNMPSVNRNITIGSRWLDNYGEAFLGDIAEILVYSGKLSQQDIQTVEYYLSSKYSIGNISNPVPEPGCVFLVIAGMMVAFKIRYCSPKK